MAKGHYRVVAPKADVTIRDVANATGVSTATVSNALNNTGKVSARTRKLVLAAVKEIGYVPNAHARNLASGNHKTFGVIVSDIENPFFPEMVKGFENRARELGYHAVLSNTNYDPELTREATERMMEQKVRGVAVMTSEIQLSLIRELARRRIAVVFLDLGPVGHYISNLRINYSLGIQKVVEHLYGLGHRRIAFVAGRPGLKSNVIRLEAYKEKMRSLGLEPGPVFAGDLRYESGIAAGWAIAGLSPRPTAVMAINDLTAVGVIKALLEAGYRVPEDVSVTGFDKTRISEYSNPSITTVDIHRDLLGRMAAEVLVELSQSENPAGKEYEIQADLVVNRSSGPAANHGG